MCDGTDHADLRESTIVVVEVDVALNAGTQFIHGGEDVSVEVLVFEDRPKAFSARMVEAVAGPTHRAGDLGLGAELDDSAIVELAASVGVEGGADPSGPLAELPPPLISEAPDKATSTEKFARQSCVTLLGVRGAFGAGF